VFYAWHAAASPKAGRFSQKLQFLDRDQHADKSGLVLPETFSDEKRKAPTARI
jgi:hypothetical protein